VIIIDNIKPCPIRAVAWIIHILQIIVFFSLTISGVCACAWKGRHTSALLFCFFSDSRAVSARAHMRHIINRRRDHTHKHAHADCAPSLGHKTRLIPLSARKRQRLSQDGTFPENGPEFVRASRNYACAFLRSITASRVAPLTDACVFSPPGLRDSPWLCEYVCCCGNSLTLGACARVTVCYSTSHFSSDYSRHKRTHVFSGG
jgi:hypothetical protein